MIQILSKTEFEKGRRIIVISDVHGHCDYLKALLGKIRYTAEDYLVLIGDLIERGHQSLATLWYVMELSKSDRVFPLMGNVDLWEGSLVEDPSVLNDKEYLEHQTRFIGYNGATMFSEMLDECNLPFPKTPEEMGERRRFLTEKYKGILDFIRSMPVILDTPTMRFVHGGMPDTEPETLLDADPYALTKNDLFLRQGYSFRKRLIVGHWPVLNYREEELNLNPLIERERNIFSIDGGMGVTRLMQLNALIFRDRDDADPESEYYDTFPVRTAKSAQPGTPASIIVHYPDNAIDIIERTGTIAVVRHGKTGRLIRIPANMVHSHLGGDNLTDEALEINPGDELGIISETEEGFLVKKNGHVGWYFGEL